MQTSMVFNQRAWPRAGDVDDCWVISAIQCVNVTAPWLPLVSVTTFRKAAGDPDDGVNDGGSIAEISAGVVGTYPVYDGRLLKLRGTPWDRFVQIAKRHRPMSVATVSAKLPTRLQFGFKGFHQVSVVVKGNGDWYVANPLAPVYSRWVKVNPAELRPAITAYGRSKTGSAGCWAVGFPDDEEMASLYHAVDDSTPFDQEDVDRVTAALAAERDALATRIEDAKGVLEGVEP